ncbi:hypothetical protein VTK73DRAFT_6372 [Phialemonium thermophilum]|uniref:Uncharacterized protein n=1 Tax=Phialemonium thermophilum TaxID=223376 RepID=A0ABR3XWI4_9PEZI
MVGHRFGLSIFAFRIHLLVTVWFGHSCHDVAFSVLLPAHGIWLLRSLYWLWSFPSTHRILTCIDMSQFRCHTNTRQTNVASAQTRAPLLYIPTLAHTHPPTRPPHMRGHSPVPCPPLRTPALCCNHSFFFFSLLFLPAIIYSAGYASTGPWLVNNSWHTIPPTLLCC